MSGKVITDQEAPQHIGAHCMDSASSEASALFWALLHAFSLWDQFNLVVFHFDALNVGFALDGARNFEAKYAIVGYLRMLMQVVETVYNPENIDCRHIKGHQGHPMNELANSLAQMALRCDTHDLSGFDFRTLIAHESFALR